MHSELVRQDISFCVLDQPIYPKPNKFKHQKNCSKHKKKGSLVVDFSTMLVAGTILQYFEWQDYKWLVTWAYLGSPWRTPEVEFSGKTNTDSLTGFSYKHRNIQGDSFDCLPSPCCISFRHFNNSCTFTYSVPGRECRFVRSLRCWGYCRNRRSFCICL